MAEIEKSEEARETGDMMPRWLGEFAWPRWAGRRPEFWSRFEAPMRV